MQKRISLLALAAVVLACGSAHSSVVYSVVGSSYTQNFDSLPNTPVNASLGASPTGWEDDTASPGSGNFSIVGWSLYHPVSQSEGGFNNHQRMRTGAGTATTGAFMSFASTTGATERALGVLNSTTIANTSGNTESYIALHLTNSTGGTLTSFTLSYNGEEYRNAANPLGAQNMNFSYSLDPAAAVNSADSVYTAVSSLGYVSPVNGGTAGQVDGNVAGRVAVSAVTVSGLNWAAGTDLWLRWAASEPASGSADGLAIDDVNFSAAALSPEPASLALLSIGALGLIRRRRH